MERKEVIQRIIDKKQAKNYLEIGVFKGDCFLHIKAKRKFAVDPEFKIDWEIRKDNPLKRIKKAIFNTYENYYQVTSDEFFYKKEDYFNWIKFDVVFIDGLHTYHQSYKDTINALDSIHDDGVVILHDCNPTTEVEAYPAQTWDEAQSLNLPGWDGQWNGDVWKTILHLRETRDDLDILVLDCDCGLGIIKKAKTKKLGLNLTEKDIESLPYQFLAAQREKILNLKSVDYFETFIAQL